MELALETVWCLVGRVRLTSTHLRGICVYFAPVAGMGFYGACAHTHRHTRTHSRKAASDSPHLFPHPSSTELYDLTGKLWGEATSQRWREDIEDTWHWGDTRSRLHLGWGGGTQKMESSSFSWQPTSVHRKPILWGQVIRDFLCPLTVLNYCKNFILINFNFRTVLHWQNYFKLI